MKAGSAARRLRLAGWIAPLLFLSLACDDDATNPVPLPDLSTPDAVFTALQDAYRDRNLAVYQELLAPEFTFRFQPVDAATLETDTWSRSQDVAGTASIFLSRFVVDIQVDLTGLEPTKPTEIQFADDVQMMRVTQTSLTVVQNDGIILHVSDRQDLFFRPGRAADGENPDRWFLLEWRDIPPPASGPAEGRLPIMPITWGSLKWRYQ